MCREVSKKVLAISETFHQSFGQSIRSYNRIEDFFLFLVPLRELREEKLLCRDA